MPFQTCTSLAHAFHIFIHNFALGAVTVGDAKMRGDVLVDALVDQALGLRFTGFRRAKICQNFENNGRLKTLNFWVE